MRIQKPETLTDLVNYQPGSIVSKTLLEKDAGSITLFAFDVDQQLKEHTSPFDAFVTILDGEAEITVSGESSVVKAGQSILMPAGKPHALKAIGKFKMLLVMIKS